MSRTCFRRGPGRRSEDLLFSKKTTMGRRIYLDRALERHAMVADSELGYKNRSDCGGWDRIGRHVGSNQFRIRPLRVLTEKIAHQRLLPKPTLAGIVDPGLGEADLNRPQPYQQEQARAQADPQQAGTSASVFLLIPSD